MTTPLIEAIAASLEPLVNDGMAEPFKSAWLTDLAQAALTAITEAGFVVCPIEPTEAMCTHGHVAMGAALIRGESRLERQAAGYRAMVNATNNGKAE